MASSFRKELLSASTILPALLLFLAAASSCFVRPIFSHNVGASDTADDNGKTNSRRSVNRDQQQQFAGDDENRAYDVLRVQRPSPSPPLFLSRLRRWSWRLHGGVLPLLHFGEADTPDVKVNLRVLWNKALSSLDPRSPAYEGPQHFWTYQMLPAHSRWILRRFRWLFPRWFHANIELRTAYLNRAIAEELNLINGGTTDNKVRIIVLGGGYDTRSVRLLVDGSIQQAYELDLPPVAESKRRLLERLYRRVSLNAELAESINKRLHLVGVDLNRLDAVESLLAGIVRTTGAEDDGGGGGGDKSEWYTIIVSEAVLMYLDDGVASKLMQLSGDVFGPSCSFCFADTLRGFPKKNQSSASLHDEEEVRQWLSRVGWELVEYLPKPGATRHLGIARKQR